MVKAVCVIAGDVKGNVYFEQVNFSAALNIEGERREKKIHFAFNFCVYQKTTIAMPLVRTLLRSKQVTLRFIFMECSRT